MSNVDPVAEFVDLIKRDIPSVETADELLTIGALIVHVLGEPQDAR